MYLLRKSKVAAHSRRTKSGGVTQVREYEDGRDPEKRKKELAWAKRYIKEVRPKLTSGCAAMQAGDARCKAVGLRPWEARR